MAARISSISLNPAAKLNKQSYSVDGGRGSYMRHNRLPSEIHPSKSTLSSMKIEISSISYAIANIDTFMSKCTKRPKKPFSAKY
jgi:hypothetical protein